MGKGENMKKENFTIELGERIRKLREKKGYSQDKMAELLDYKSKASIFKIEQGITDLPVSKIEEIAKVLSTTTEYLMGWEEKEPELTIIGIKKCELPVYELNTSGDGSLIYKGVEVFIMEENFEFKEGAFAVNIIENELQPRMLDGDTILIEKMTFDDWREHKGKLVIIEHQSLKKARIVDFQNGEPVLVSITGFEKNINITEKIEYFGVATNLIRRKLY